MGDPTPTLGCALYFQYTVSTTSRLWRILYLVVVYTAAVLVRCCIEEGVAVSTTCRLWDILFTTSTRGLQLITML